MLNRIWLYVGLLVMFAGCKVKGGVAAPEPEASPTPTVTEDRAVEVEEVEVIASPTPSPTPTPSPPPTPTPSPTPTLVQTATCLDTNTFQESASINYGYLVTYTRSTYSDATTAVTCRFSSLTTITNAGTCVVPVNADGVANEYRGASGCGFATQANFIYGLACDTSTPFTYSFHVEALPGQGWVAKDIGDTVAVGDCAVVNF